MTPLNTTPVAENPQLVNLRERKAMLVQKMAEHDKADANDYQRRGFDLPEIKRRTQSQIAELDREIAKLATK